MKVRRGHRSLATVAPAVALVLVLGGCAGTGPTASGRDAGSGAPLASLPAGFPIGRWTTTITEADLRAAGLTEAGEIAENVGVFTTTFAPDGVWTTTQKTSAPVRWPVFRGTWTAVGPDTIRQTTTFPPDFAGDVVDVTWRRDAEGLHLGVPEPPDPILPIITETHPWQPAG